MVNNHGDRFRPLRIGLVPFQMAVFWLINRGDPNHLVTGMILQVDIEPPKHLLRPGLYQGFNHLLTRYLDDLDDFVCLGQRQKNVKTNVLTKTFKTHQADIHEP